MVDLDCRLKSGQPQRTEDYLREFPDLQAYEQVILKLLRVEARWQVSAPPAANDGGAELVSGSGPLDADERSSGAALETAASDADLSVIGATRSAAPGGVSEPNYSGETVSARDLPSKARLPTASTLGRFRLVDAVGQGGFGTVFRDRHGSGESRRDQSAPGRCPRIRKGAGAIYPRGASAAALRHAHIVSVHEVGGTRERPFIVSEFVRGQTLSRALAGGPFEPKVAAKIVRVVADASVMRTARRDSPRRQAGEHHAR